tara:strand:- start:78 stop:308 length:231 start_codon:yes stop_codon:yes gene_type:complete
MTLKEEIEKILEFKIEDIKDNIKLPELGYDSIKIVELSSVIYEHTNIELKYNDIYNIDKKWILDIIRKYDKLNLKK